MSATSNSLLSQTLSQSLIKPRRLSQSPISLSLSLQSNHRSSSIVFCSLDGLNNTNQGIPIEKRMFCLAFLFSFLCFHITNLCFEKKNHLFNRFLQNTQHFLRSWILIRYVKFCRTGGSFSNSCLCVRVCFMFRLMFSPFLCFRMLFLVGVVGFRFC